MSTTVLILLGVVSVFALAFGLPPRTARHLARAFAGVAVAVATVAYVLFLVIEAPQFTIPVFAWIAVGWLAFPVTITAFGLALTLREQPAVKSLWVAAFLLFAISTTLDWSVGSLIAPSALLMFLAAVFALGSTYDAGERNVEPARG